jgi:ribosomal protein S6
MKKDIPVTDVAKDPVIYEVGYHIVPIVGEDNLGARATKVRDAIESHKGIIISDEFPRSVDLVYPIAKVAANKRATYSSAYFGWFKFQALPDAVRAIDADLKKDVEILRYIIVKTVRENTMSSKKALREAKREETQTDEPREEKPKMTDEEMDKTVDDLVSAVES